MIKTIIQSALLLLAMAWIARVMYHVLFVLRQIYELLKKEKENDIKNKSPRKEKNE